MRIDFSPKKRWVLISLFIILVCYCLFQARFLILGPQVSIDNPRDGEVMLDNVVTVEGKAKNIAWITLNDRPIFTDEKGLWSEKLIVQDGTSIMTVHAKDRFGREVSKSIQIVLK